MSGLLWNCCWCKPVVPGVNRCFPAVRIDRSLFRLTVDLVDDGVDSHFLVVLLERCQILSGLCKLSFLHSFADVPVHEGSLREQQVELVVEASPGLCNGRCVA